MKNKTLQIQQLDRKMQVIAELKNTPPPPIGWIKAVRTSLGISLQQLGNKIGITKQSVSDLERREVEGTITLRSLKEVAQALDMELVYGLVPKDATLEDLIHRKAHELAAKIIMRTANTMQLEDQANSPERLKKAVEERAILLKNEMPKILWD